MKNNLIIRIVMLLIGLLTLTQMSSFATTYFVNAGETFNPFILVENDTIQLCKTQGPIYLKAGEQDNGGCYEWGLYSGVETSYIITYNPLIETQALWQVPCVRCDASYIIFYVQILDSPLFNQFFTVCDGESVTVGSHTYTTAGTYIDTIPAVNTCDSIMTTNLTVNSFPTISFQFDSIEIQQGQFVILDPVVTDANTYLWSTGATTSTITVGVTGTYYVTVSNDCGSVMDSVFLDVITGISYFSNSTNSNDNIYPNPVKNLIKIDISSESIKKINIFNQTGQLMLEFNNVMNNKIIDVSSLANGLYYMQLQPINESNKCFKFIKQ